MGLGKQPPVATRGCKGSPWSFSRKAQRALCPCFICSSPSLEREAGEVIPWGRGKKRAGRQDSGPTPGRAASALGGGRKVLALSRPL